MIEVFGLVGCWKTVTRHSREKDKGLKATNNKSSQAAHGWSKEGFKTMSVLRREIGKIREANDRNDKKQQRKVAGNNHDE